MGDKELEDIREITDTTPAEQTEAPDVVRCPACGWKLGDDMKCKNPDCEAHED